MSTGTELAEEGMARVEANTDPAWQEAAFIAICRTAKELHEFTSDDVWERLDADAHNNSALGPVMRIAAREGVSERTGTFREGIRPEHHGKPIRVWRSLMCANPPATTYSMAFAWSTIVELFDEPLDQRAIEELTESQRQQVMRVVRDLLPGGRTLQEAVDFAVLSL